MLVRVRGDSYPIKTTIKVNGSPIDLTGAILTFSYREGSTLHTINGRITDAINGIVEFFPSASDFQTVGSFPFDIQRNQGGYTYTHKKDMLVILDDVIKG